MATETFQPPDTDGRKDGPDQGAGVDTQNSRAWHEWLAIGVGLSGILAIGAIIISIVALSSKNPTSGPKTVTIQQAANPAPAVAPLNVTITSKSDVQHAKKGPDGQWHDAILGGNMTVKPGQTVHVTAYNYDDAPHSYTAPDLGLNVKLDGAPKSGPSVTKFTFKAPTKPGTYQWFCGYPCDPWAMSHDGYMRGHVTVTA